MNQIEQLELLQQTILYMRKLISDMEKIINNYHSGVSRNIVNGVIAMVEGVTLICDAVVATYDIHEMTADLEYLNARLGELVVAIEKADYLFAVDLLEYEILVTLSHWERKLNSKIEGDCHVKQ